LSRPLQRDTTAAPVRQGENYTEAQRAARVIGQLSTHRAQVIHGLLPAERLFEVGQRLAETLILGRAPVDQPVGMENCPVVAPAKRFSHVME